MTDKKSRESRRKLLKSIATGSGAVVVGKTLPESWSRPVVDSVMLPAHAQASLPPLCDPYRERGIATTILLTIAPTSLVRLTVDGDILRPFLVPVADLASFDVTQPFDDGECAGTRRLVGGFTGTPNGTGSTGTFNLTFDEVCITERCSGIGPLNTTYNTGTGLYEGTLAISGPLP